MDECRAEYDEDLAIIRTVGTLPPPGYYQIIDNLWVPADPRNWPVGWVYRIEGREP